MADVQGKSPEMLSEAIERERTQLAVHLRELRLRALDAVDLKQHAKKALGHAAARLRTTWRHGVETARAHPSVVLASAGALGLLCLGAWRLRRRSHPVRRWRW
jgi:hypothetical protein